MERLLRQFRIRPGNLDVYLEILGLSGVRRAIYKAGAGFKIRHDDRMLSDIEAAVGPGNVRLLGNRGATARVESVATVAAPAPTENDYEYVESPSDDD